MTNTLERMSTVMALLHTYLQDEKTQGKVVLVSVILFFSSTKEVLIYILDIRYGLTTYIFAKRPNRETNDTVIRYTFFPLYRRKKR
jgi:hypothetical protein